MAPSLYPSLAKEKPRLILPKFLFPCSISCFEFHGGRKAEQKFLKQTNKYTMLLLLFKKYYM